MYIVRRIYECPCCNRLLGNFVKLSDNSFHVSDTPTKYKIASDGHGWTGITDDYVMCPECRNVFDIETGNNGGSTRYEEPELPPESFIDKFLIFIGHKKRTIPVIAEKDVIKDGFDLYERAFRVDETRKGVRCSIILHYVWEIERLEKSVKEPYLQDYNEAISEILEILEKENRVKPFFEPDLITQTSYLPDEKTGEYGEPIVEVIKNYKDREAKLLLMAEFYRRKGMFDRAIAALDGHTFKTLGHYQEMAEEIIDSSKKQQSQLFYLEIMR